MKKYLLTGALITITATTLYATTAGSAVVDKMKAAAHSFTLATSLNPTDSGLTSDPVKGKKTGDIFTAGEYNRILELLSEGGSGGGSFQISFKKDYTKDGNSSVPTTENIGSHDFCALTRYGEGVKSDGTAGYCKVEKGTNDIWTVSIQALNNNINCQVTCFTGGGGASTSGGPALYKCTNAQSLDTTNAPCYGASRNGGAGTNQYRVVSCTDNDGTRSYTMSSILNFGQLVANKWAVSVNGGTIECDDGTVLVMDILGGGSGGSGTTNTGPGSACGTDGYGIVMYQSTDYNPRKKQCCYIGNGGAVSGGYHDGLVRHLSCSDL